MSNESTPPPPPPLPGDENVAPQAPKLKLTKPASVTPAPAPAPTASPAFVPPPPPPAAAEAPAARVTPPPPLAARPLPTTGVVANRGNVGKVAATFDIIALLASIGGAVILAIELFSKTKG